MPDDRVGSSEVVACQKQSIPDPIETIGQRREKAISGDICGAQKFYQSQIRRSIVDAPDFCQFFTDRRQRGIGRIGCFPANDRGGFDTGTKLPLPLPSSGYRCTGTGG